MSELAAPAGGRAYRWMWCIPDHSFFGVYSTGYVDVRINADGSGVLRSTWNERAQQLASQDIAAFEAALEATPFAGLPEQDKNAANWLDYPAEQVMEAVVGGRYHFVHRIGGITETGIYEAGAMLEKLARAKAGVR